VLVPDAVIVALPSRLGRSASAMESTRTSLLGNAFHAPSVTMVLSFTLADLASASAVQRPIYATGERYLRLANLY
jgi:hypothetical protein